MPLKKLVVCLSLLFTGGLFFIDTAEAKIKVSCIDSDEGLNLSQEGEVTVTASYEGEVLMQRSLRDRNWLGKKQYVEFYCDERAEFPLYRLISCDSADSTNLPSNACPAAEKGSIMLEVRHASQQPKAIIESPGEFLAYYNVSLAAPVDNVLVKSLRLNIGLGGLKKGSNAAMILTPYGTSSVLKNSMLAWDSANPAKATAVWQFDPPLSVNMGTSKTLTMWLQNIAETAPYSPTDNQIAVTIEDIELENHTKIYTESKAQINSFQQN